MITENMKRKSKKFKNSVTIVNYNLKSKYGGVISIDAYDHKSSGVCSSNEINVYFVKTIGGIKSTIIGQAFNSHEKAMDFIFSVSRALYSLEGVNL